MYNYTAARLAENTNSIVVVPTFTSNFFVGDGLWINGPALQPVVADLFTGSRQALTASALAAGYAERYGLNAADAELPRAFALSGHSAAAARWFPGRPVISSTKVPPRIWWVWSCSTVSPPGTRCGMR